MAGRRIHDRYETVIPVTVKHPGGQVQGNTINISLGGMKVTLEGAVPFGAEVQVMITLPALKEPSSLPATVRWLREGEVGIQFGSLRAKEVWALNQLFRDAPKLSDADA